MKNSEIVQIIKDNTEQGKIILRKIEQMENRIQDFEKQKYKPFNLEQEVMQNLRTSMQTAIKQTCNDALLHNADLRDMVRCILVENNDRFRVIIKEAVDEALNDPVMKLDLLTELKKKLARTVVNSALASCESNLNDIRKDTEMMSKMKLIIVDIVNNYELTKIK